MKMNMKKGANAYVLSVGMIVLGTFMLCMGLLIVPHIPNTWWQVKLHIEELIPWGKMLIVAGGIGFLFALPGSFFSFKTENLMMGVIGAALLTVAITFVFYGYVVVAGISILQNPWVTDRGMVLVKVFGFLLFSTFFLHAARPAEEKPDTMERALKKAIQSGKVILFHRPKKEHNH